MKNIEDYGFDRSDLVIATAVNSYLKKLTPEAREETLAGIVRQDGAETRINGERVAADGRRYRPKACHCAPVRTLARQSVVLQNSRLSRQSVSAEEKGTGQPVFRLEI